MGEHGRYCQRAEPDHYGEIYYCTEPEGHGGDHVTRDAHERELHRWPNEGSESDGE